MSFSKRSTIAFLLSFLSATFALRADDDSTRSFPAYKCKFTLPEKDWKWSNKHGPDIVFSAEGPGGDAIFLTAVPHAGDWNDALTAEFERLILGQQTKRSGGYVDLRGLKGYQATGSFPPQNIVTTASRLYLRNGMAYTMSVVSVSDIVPAEERVDFPAIVNGLQFDATARVILQNENAAEIAKLLQRGDNTNDISYRMGYLAGSLLTLALIGLIVKKLLGYG